MSAAGRRGVSAQSGAPAAGAWGEEQAAAYLSARGWRILSRNFRTRFGELDIVASDGRYLAFAEVKLRKSCAYGAPREFVTRAKQQRLIAAAQIYLLSHPNTLQPRFDVIEIYAPGGAGGACEINHIINAFEVEA